MALRSKTSFVIPSDDTVVCCLFSISPQASNTNWRQLCTEINDSIEKLTQNYIWHRDEFRFSIPIQENIIEGTPTHLVSSTCFGDNIEDEWFIVYIVFEITKQFDDVIIQIRDSDGEFLLIEAADHLPCWANPESTENRVFIWKNNIHLIPKLVNTNSDLSVEKAINIIKYDNKRTLASLDIQNAIHERISGYPDKIMNSIHNAIVKLPVDIATLLSLKPSLIAPLVTTFCNHDPIDAKSCRDVNFQNCIDVKVKFTKCLYAMLVHSKLTPSLKKYKVNENDKKTSHGYKLTCGYHMIMNKTNDLFMSKEFNKFINSLKINEYFKDNLEGSKDYTKLLENAKDYFLQMECPVSSYVANNITNIMCSDEFFKQKETMKLSTNVDLSEDNDDWLNIHPDQLNDLLNKRYGKTEKFKNNDIVTPHSISSKLSDFLKQTSGFEGIEQSESKEETVHFEPDDFVNSLEKMLNLLSSGRIADQSSESELEDDFDLSDDEMSQEIKRELQHEIFPSDDSHNLILENIVRSVKEEQGSSGPSSTILRSIGINKTDVLDSDDD